MYGLKEDWTIISEDCTSLYEFSIVSGFSKVVQTMRSSDLKIPIFERLMQLQLYSQNFS